MQKQLSCNFKKQKSEYMVLERDAKNNISICLVDEKRKEKAVLYAVYYLRESLNLEEVRSFSIHLQTIKVYKKYRRKGIATQMMQALIKELLEVEKEENCRFTLIKGEIGNAGEDNPRLSKPFYHSFDGALFGNHRKLVLRIEKNATEEGLDRFCYYIIEKLE